MLCSVELRFFFCSLRSYDSYWLRWCSLCVYWRLVRDQEQLDHLSVHLSSCVTLNRFQEHFHFNRLINFTCNCTTLIFTPRSDLFSHPDGFEVCKSELISDTLDQSVRTQFCTVESWQEHRHYFHLMRFEAIKRFPKSNQNNVTSRTNTPQPSNIDRIAAKVCNECNQANSGKSSTISLDTGSNGIAD